MKKLAGIVTGLMLLAGSVDVASAADANPLGTCETRFKSAGYANWNRTDVEFDRLRSTCLIDPTFPPVEPGDADDVGTCETRFKIAGQANWRRYNVRFNALRGQCIVSTI